MNISKIWTNIIFSVLLLCPFICGYEWFAFLTILIAIIAYLRQNDSKSFVTYEPTHCPCCQTTLSKPKLLYTIIKNPDTIHCYECGDVIATLKYHRKKINFITFSLLAIFEIAFVTGSQYKTALIFLFIVGMLYLYFMSFIRLQCYQNIEVVNDDPIIQELKQIPYIPFWVVTIFLIVLISAIVLKVLL